MAEQVPDWLPSEVEDRVTRRREGSESSSGSSQNAYAGLSREELPSPQIRSSFYDGGGQSSLDDDYQSLPWTFRYPPSNPEETVYETLDETTAGDSHTPRRDTVVWAREDYGGQQGEFNGPGDIAYSPFHKRFVVVDTCNFRLQVLSSHGKPLNHIGQGLIYPTGIAYNQTGIAYVTNCLPCSVGVLVLGVDGYQTAVFGQSHLIQPRGIDCDKNGQVVVSDISKKKISVFSPDGKLVRSFSSTPSKKFRQVSRPAQLAVDSKQRLLVSDCGLNVIKIFDLQGKLLKEFNPVGGVKMDAEHQQQGICVDSMDNILVALYHNNTVAKFSPDGQFMECVLTQADGLKYPVGISAGVQNMAVTESNKGCKHAAVKVLRMS